MSVGLKENLNYKIKIDVPNVIELISETFDNILNYMPPKMLVFGGTLRDIIAGFGLHHDLDIIGLLSEEEEFVHYLETSSKWMEERVIIQYKKQIKTLGKTASGVTSPHCMGNGMLDLDRTLSNNMKFKPSTYNNIQNVRTFINSSGHKLQIITNKYDLFTLREVPPINIAKTVDFVCCGLIMDTDGNVYEVVEGAKDDCIKRTLRINKNADIKFHNLTERIKKFTARGWKSEINLAKLKYRQIHLKRKTERLERSQSKSSTDCIQIYNKWKSGKVQIVINTSKMQIFNYCENNAIKVLEAFSALFIDYHLTKDYEINTSYTNNNQLIVNVFARNVDIALKLRNILLDFEHKNLPIRKFKITKKTSGYSVGRTISAISSSADFGFPPLKLDKVSKHKANYGSFSTASSKYSITSSKYSTTSSGYENRIRGKEIIFDGNIEDIKFDGNIEINWPPSEEVPENLIKPKAVKKKLHKDPPVTDGSNTELPHKSSKKDDKVKLECDPGKRCIERIELKSSMKAYPPLRGAFLKREYLNEKEKKEIREYLNEKERKEMLKDLTIPLDRLIIPEKEKKEMINCLAKAVGEPVDERTK